MISRYAQHDDSDLSPAELRVFELIVKDGLTDAEIAKRLHRTIGGVKETAKVIRAKKGFWLGAGSRVKMIVGYWKSQVSA